MVLWVDSTLGYTNGKTKAATLKKKKKSLKHSCSTGVTGMHARRTYESLSHFVMCGQQALMHAKVSLPGL